MVKYFYFCENDAMKKLLVILLSVLSISSCSFVKDVQKHCRPEMVSGDIQTASFNVCLKCDSLAKVVWDNIQKQKAKQ